jgi:exodeoxyribonuclease V beta subunit
VSHPILVPRPAVVSRMPRTGHVVVEAAAGTGKTFTLEHLVVDLLLGHGLSIERLLVVTFTEKATEELRLRVRRKLQELADFTEQPEPVPAAADAWTLDDDARVRLREALVRFDTATIATIHGFCQRVLTEHAFAHRRLFDQRLVDARETFTVAFRDVLRQGLGRQDPLRGALAGYLRGGGSVEALEELVFDAASQRGELTPRWDPTGFAAALAEVRATWSPTLLKQALDAVGASRREVFETYGNLGALAADEGATADPADVARKIVDWGAKKHDIAKVTATRWEHLRRGLERLGTPDAKRLTAALDRLPAVAAPPLPALVGALRKRVRERLEDHKRSRGLYDFDDMLLQVREGVCGPAADPALVAALRARWSVALVDEFQDTDEVQWDIFRGLFFASPDHRLFLIGDPRQAIYGFRNADVMTYLAARQAVVAGGGQRVPLLANYRSTPAVIAACNAVFADGYFSSEDVAAEPAVPGNPGLRLTDPSGTALPPVVVWRVHDEGKRPRAAAAREALAERIALEARELVTTGVRFGDPAARGGDAERPLRYGDLQILVRGNNDTAVVAETLRRHGVPCILFGQEGLFSTAEAENVQRLLAALATPDDAAVRLRAWLTPFFDVPLAGLAGCRELAETHPLVARLLAWSEEAAARRYPALFRRLMHDSGLVRRLLATRQGERELTDYQHLFDLLLEDAHRAPAPVADLAARLRLWIEGEARPLGAEVALQRLEPARDAVQILTMHRAKGLQAAVVFVFGGFGDSGAQDQLKVYHAEGERRLHLGGTLGDVGAAIERERREENERLLYVALTRARGRLYLPWLGSGGGRGGGSYEVVERRLDALLTGERCPGFEVVEVPCGAAPAAGEVALPWPPPAGWPPPEERPEDPSFTRLRRSRAGRLLTSYSRVRRGATSAAEEAAADPDAGFARPRAAAGPDDLPGGTASGTFVHRLLEELDLEPLRRASDAAEWTLRPEVVGLGRRLATELAFPTTAVPAAIRLAWLAMRTPVAAEGLELPAGLAEPALRAVETEMVFPIPEPWHPRLGEASARDEGDDTPPLFRAGRGYVQGVVDLVFEHQGRTWFVDWKTDRLPSFDAATLAGHVELHYRLQAQLYALGVLRLLGIRSQEDHARRFGGLCYCFVRGLGAGEGFHVERPSWRQLQEWEDALRLRQSWGQKWEGLGREIAAPPELEVPA